LTAWVRTGFGFGAVRRFFTRFGCAAGETRLELGVGAAGGVYVRGVDTGVGLCLVGVARGFGGGAGFGLG
jgi:hypothetical protein